MVNKRPDYDFTREPGVTTRPRSRSDQIARLKRRLDTLPTKSEDAEQLIGVMRGILDVMTDDARESGR